MQSLDNENGGLDSYLAGSTFLIAIAPLYENIVQFRDVISKACISVELPFLRTSGYSGLYCFAGFVRKRIK